jgi:hypothetical protein
MTISRFARLGLNLGVFAAVLFAASCSTPPPPAEVKVVIGPSARIGGVLYERVALVIEGEQLIAAGAQGDVPIPAGSNKMDLTGKHLIDVPDVGKPATFTVLVCNPEGEPSCASKVFKHMKNGMWLD